MDFWEIGVAAAGACVSIGASLARREAPRETMAPEIQAVRGDLKRLEDRFEAFETRERDETKDVAEFRGEVRAMLARIFEKLNIQRGGGP